MFYIYQFDHFGTYKKVWRLYKPVQAFAISSSALLTIRNLARENKLDIEQFRSVFYAEPRDVEEFVASAYYSETDQEALRKKYFCR